MLVFEDERKLKGKGIGATARVGDRAIPVTNLDKVLYPAAERHQARGDRVLRRASRR